MSFEDIQTGSVIRYPYLWHVRMLLARPKDANTARSPSAFGLHVRKAIWSWSFLSPPNRSVLQGVLPALAARVHRSPEVAQGREPDAGRRLDRDS